MIKIGVANSHGGGKTEFLVDIASGNISSRVGRDKTLITISQSSSIRSNTLAHEFGHNISLAADPIKYYKVAQGVDGHSCQDPANRHSYFSEKAMDWQERYDKLYRIYKKGR